jgi:hypothetical protein
MGDTPLKDKFPRLYNIALSQMDSVARICGGVGHLRFRGQLDQDLSRDYQELHLLIAATTLLVGQDNVSWSLEGGGVFFD